jgi:peptidyl-prolyl cis-trans isomerase B (cyclophilin B)
VGKQDRQRKLARVRYQRWLQRRAERARRARQWTAISAAGVAVIVLAVIGYFVFGSSSSTPAAAPTASATASATSATPPPSPPAPTTTVQPAAAVSKCTYVSSPPAARNVGTPLTKPDATAKYQATIHTNRGDIVIRLADNRATCTVNSFVYLASHSYFSNTKCHRLTTTGIYVLQCGDPTGTGTGSPGYRFANEVSGDSTTSSAIFPAGTIAMAHSSQPDSNGSQFFLVYQQTTLPPDYTPFGTITSGLAVLQNVAKAGVAANAAGSGDGPPRESVIIQSVTINKI